MNKKGAEHTFWVIITVLLAVAVAVWFFIYIWPNLAYGATGIKGKTEELFKSWSEYTPFEKEKVIKENPKQAAELELNELIKVYSNPFNSIDDLRTLKEKASTLRSKFNKEYKKDVSEQNIKVLDDLLEEIESKIGTISTREAIIEAEKKRKEGVSKAELSPEELIIYNELRNEFDIIIKDFYTLKIYNFAIEKLNLLKEKIQGKKINKKLFNDLEAETVVRILSSYSQLGNCETVGPYLNALKQYYSTSTGTHSRDEPVLERGYFWFMDCYANKFKLESNPPKKEELAYKILNIGDEYSILYPNYYVGESKRKYDESLFYLAKADCSMADTMSKCAANEKYIIVENYKERKSFLYNIPLSAVKKNKKLGCYWNLVNIAECLNCEEYNILSCKQYASLNTYIFDEEPWVSVCKLDPCQVADGPCGYDDGSGIGNIEGCCPNRKTKC